MNLNKYTKIQIGFHLKTIIVFMFLSNGSLFSAQSFFNQSKTPAEIHNELRQKISSFLIKLITENKDSPNSVIQSNIIRVLEVAKSSYRKSLEKNQFNSRSEEKTNEDFSRIWVQAINHVYEIEIEQEEIEESEINSQINEIFDAHEKKQKNEKNPHFFKVNTTLLNILMRDCQDEELPDKVRTLIELGFDKNLNKLMSKTEKIENQKEFCLVVALFEIRDLDIRRKVVDILLDDTIQYSYNSLLPQGERLNGIKKTLGKNKNFIGNVLIEQGDFNAFEIFISKAEKMGIMFVEEYSEELSQIRDQIWCPLLEKILDKMRAIRKTCITTNEEGDRVDNISELLTSKYFKKQIHLNSDAMFSLHFQNRLQKDYESLFNKIAKKIDYTRTVSEITGDKFKQKLISWVTWANFRNRVAKHLNKFALTASNNAKKSNVIRLIRYANIYDDNSEGTEQGDLFKELSDFGGSSIIFTTKNKLKWTPAMYAMVQKQSEGIQLLLKQAINKVTDVDGVGNNILHLAFPLPESLFKNETQVESQNVLDMVGAELGEIGARRKTTEAIKAIITEQTVPNPDKIKALKQVSSSNFTPVSLAAVTGNIETYEFLKEFLLSEGEWQEDEHAHLGTHIEELILRGLKNYREEQITNGTLGDQDREELNSTISKKEKKIKERYGRCVHEVYNLDEDSSIERLELLRKKAIRILDDFAQQKGTKQKDNPYKKSLDTVVEEITKRRFSLGGQNPLAGLRDSTSIVKTSYLAPIVKEITEIFLSHKRMPVKMKFNAVYEAMTKVSQKDYFSRKISRLVEKKMQEAIIDTMRQSGRLEEEENINKKDKNRFNQIVDESSSSSEESDNDACLETKEDSQSDWEI